jgi:hypothetical protein
MHINENVSTLKCACIFVCVYTHMYQCVYVPMNFMHVMYNIALHSLLLPACLHEAPLSPECCIVRCETETVLIQIHHTYTYICLCAYSKDLQPKLICTRYMPGAGTHSEHKNLNRLMWLSCECIGISAYQLISHRYAW